MKPKNKPQSSKSKESVADKAAKFFGKTKTEPTPGQIATQNRDISAEIISVLRSIDFAHGRLKNLIDEEEYRMMIRVRDVAMKMLQESPTIFDEVAQIGAEMSYAAKSWKEAVKIGMPNKAMHAKQAVASGATFFWSNIPEDKEAERSVILKNREEYFKKHRMAIQLGENVDSLEKELASLKSNITKKIEKRAPLMARVRELKETEEGREKLTRLFKSKIDPQGLNSEDQKFAEEMLDDVSLIREIEGLVEQCEAKVTELSANRMQLSQVDQALSRNPDLIKRDLTPEVAAMWDAVADEMRRAEDRSAVAFEEHKKSIDKMKAALQSESAKQIRNDYRKHILKTINPDEISSEDAAEHDANRALVDRQIRKADEAKARQKEKARQAEAARQAAIEAAKQAQANEETAQAENENVAAESADNFNYNF